MVITKRIIAGILYICGLVFAAFIVYIVVKGHTIFDVDGLIISTLGVCLPAAIATMLMIAATKETEKRYKTMKAFILIVFVFWCTLMLNMLFFNGHRQLVVSRSTSITEFVKWNTNFIPFRTIGNYIRSYFNDSINKSIVIYNLFGNIVLFMPFGLLLPSLFRSLNNFIKFSLVVLIAFAFVEIGQLLTRTGSCDIDDVILNFTGAALFYGLWSLKFMQRMMRKIYIVR